MWVHGALAMAGWLAGVWWQLQQAEVGGPARAALMALVAVAGLLSWWGVAGRRWAPLAPVLVMVALGWGWAEWRSAHGLAQAWPSAWSREVVMLTGRVETMPQAQAWGQQLKVAVLTVEHGQRRWRAGERWDLPDGAAGTTVPGLISLTWSSPAATPLPGEVWRWAVILEPPAGHLNPGGFDRERWMFEQGLRAQGRVVTRGDVRQPLQIRPAAWWRGGIERWRTRLRDRINQGIDDPRVRGLVAGLTIGDQSAITQDDWDALRDTGTAHLAAISGLHVTMMGWWVAALAGWGWRRSWWLMHRVPAPAAAAVAGLLGALGYALLAGWGVPAQRTVLMLAVVVSLRLTARRWPAPMVLLLAAVAVTLWDPWALAQAGFWLSFAAVGVLLMTAPSSTPLASSSWPERLARAVRSGIRTQWVAFVGLAPLSLIFFQQVSLVGLLANLVCIPLFSLVVTPLAMVGLAVPAAWTVLQPVALHTLQALAAVSQWAWAAVSGPSVTGWAAALGLLAAAWALVPVLPLRVRLAGLPLLLPLLWPSAWSQSWPAPPAGELEVLAVDVGQGTAVLVRTAGHALLYDAGPAVGDSNDAGRRILAGLLKSLGVRALDMLMISHGDSDHVGGAASVIRSVPVKVLSSSLEAGHRVFSVGGAGGGRPVAQRCEAGQRWVWDGVQFEVLHPHADDWHAPAESDNARSCVLRVQDRRGRSALLTGDIETAQEAALRERLGSQLASEVLLVPHHGSRTSSTPGFLSAVKPQVAVIQVGRRNRYGHPHPQVLARYQDLGVPVHASPRCGAWRWRSGEGPAVTAGQCWRQVSRRYWQVPLEPASVAPP